MKAVFVCAVVMFSLVLVFDSSWGQEEKKSKITTKEVMKQAMKGGLAKKVAEGKATEAEKKQLVELFVAMHENAPPKGEQSDYQKLTISLVDAAKAAESGDEKAGQAITKLINCANCHKRFKG